MRLVAGLCPDPLGELIQRSPRSPSWVKMGKKEGEWERGKGRGVQRHPGDAKCVTEIRKLGEQSLNLVS